MVGVVRFVDFVAEALYGRWVFGEGRGWGAEGGVVLLERGENEGGEEKGVYKGRHFFVVVGSFCRFVSLVILDALLVLRGIQTWYFYFSSVGAV